MQSTFKWRALIGLVIVFLSLVMNWQWLWGVLFIFWVIPDLMSGYTHFMEPVERKANPFIYWTIILTWIGLSIYMIAAHFYPEYVYGDQYAQYNTQAAGEYEFQADPYQNSNDSSLSYVATKVGEGKMENTSNSLTSSNPNAPKEKLDFKTYNSPAFNLIGISTITTNENNQATKDLKGLWNYFYSEDLSVVIPNILDEKIFVAYTDYDKPAEGYFKVTIGYKTKNLDYVYDGLTGIHVPSTQFAVFQPTGDPSKSLPATWTKILASDIQTAQTVDIEVYSDFDKDLMPKKGELWVAQKTNGKVKHIEGKEKGDPPASTSATSPPKAPQPLNYKEISASAFNVVGISMETTYNNDQYLGDMTALWEAFYKEDISSAIRGIQDEKVYVVYSDFDKPKKGSFKVTMGFKTKSTKNLYKGLTGVNIPKTKFAAFFIPSKPETQVPAMWEKIYRSNLKKADNFDVEVYDLDKKTYEPTKAQILVGIK